AFALTGGGGVTEGHEGQRARTALNKLAAVVAIPCCLIDCTGAGFFGCEGLTGFEVIERDASGVGIPGIDAVHPQARLRGVEVTLWIRLKDSRGVRCEKLVAI